MRGKSRWPKLDSVHDYNEKRVAALLAIHGIPFHSASLTLGSSNLLHRHRVVQDCILLHKVAHCCTILNKLVKQLYKDVHGCTRMYKVV